MTEIEKADFESENLVEDRLQQLRELMPEAFSESGIDFDKLRLLLGDEVDEGDERYAFTWPGKANAIRQSQTSTTATLRPLVEKSRSRSGKDRSFDSNNIYIEGDNLETLKLLQRAYHGKVKLIYIDPPYNTGHDFVYKDKFGDTIENYKEQTGQTNQSNPETSGRFHSDWCSMMYPRLKLARELLTRDGVISISIDDNELSNLLSMLCELFGQNNIVAIFPRVTKKAGKSSEALAKNHDYVVLVSRTSEPSFYPPLQTGESDYSFRDEFVDKRGPYKLNQCLDYDSLQYSATLDYPITLEGEVLYPGGDYEAYKARKAGDHARADWAWRWSKEKFEFGLANGFVVLKRGGGRPRIYTKTYLNAAIEERKPGSKEYFVAIAPRTKPLSTLEYTDNQYSNDNANKSLASIFSEKGLFDYSKPVSLIKSLVSFCTKENDIVLDFFSGSGTTGQGVMEKNSEDEGNRKILLVQLPEPFPNGSVAKRNGYENLCQLGEERLRQAGDKIAKEIAENNKQPKLGKKLTQLPDIGFRCFKLDSSGIEHPKEGQLLIDRRKSDRTDLDIIFEVMLKWGYELTYPIEETEFAGYGCYSVAEGDLICCMKPGLTVDALQAIADELPRRVFVMDSVFGSDDSLKLDALAIFKHAEERTQQKIELRTV
ncbi:MAG: site-specific DNA-methyltransferase [Eggerthellaceae bacterium]|jgi:adenine-specific DNA-methyltransferase